MRLESAVPLRPVWRCAVLVVLLATLAPISPLVSQKPIPTPRVNVRPQRPDTITVEHAPNGAIMVKWTAVPGAKDYFLGRSRGNEGWRRIQRTFGGSGSTYYPDYDVQPGVRYRYQVATIDSADRVSIRINSDTIVGRPRSIDMAPRNVFASVTAPGQVTIRWNSVYGATQYRVERRPEPNAAGAVAPRSQLVGSTTFVDDIGSGDADRTVVYHVYGLMSGPGGDTGPPGRSNAVTIPGLSTGTSDTPGADAPGDAGSTESAGSASVMVTIAPAATVRRGASSRLTAGAAGAQWLSLDPRIATTTPDGTVVGRAPGEAQIVAISRGADGAVRVSVVRVTVAP